MFLKFRGIKKKGIFAVLMLCFLFSNHLVYAESWVVDEVDIGNKIESVLQEESFDVINFENIEEMDAYMELNDISEDDIFVTIPYSQEDRAIGYLRGTISFPSKTSVKVSFLNIGTGNITKLNIYGDVYDINYNIRAGFAPNPVSLSPLESYSKTYTFASINPILKVEVGYDFMVDGVLKGGYGEKYNY